MSIGKQTKTISISAKCSDLCNTQLVAEDGKILFEISDYVPGFMPEEHYGDYVMLDIDVETGVIKNWKKPGAAAIDRWIKST